MCASPSLAALLRRGASVGGAALMMRPRTSLGALARREFRIACAAARLACATVARASCDAHRAWQSPPCDGVRLLTRRGEPRRCVALSADADAMSSVIRSALRLHGLHERGAWPSARASLALEPAARTFGRAVSAVRHGPAAAFLARPDAMPMVAGFVFWLTWPRRRAARRRRSRWRRRR